MSPSPTADAIHRWNDLVASETDLDGAIAGWREHFAERDLQLDGRPLCSVLRPHMVELQREAYPTMEPGAPARGFYEDTDPFIFRGEFGGLLTRLAGSEVTNVHADASVGASVAVGRRG